MDDENSTRMSSVSKASDFKYDNADNALDDPISAYFKQRCGNFSKTYFKKCIESDSDSSIGLIDVDNVSLFGDGDEKDIRLTGNSLPPLDRLKSLSPNATKPKKFSDVQGSVKSDSELHLEKQRALAQKALKRISKPNEAENPESILKNQKSRESQVLSDISSKVFNSKVSTGRGSQKWFQPNYSPNTPRVFNDELSSLGGEDSDFLMAKNESKHKLSPKEIEIKRQSQYTKKVNSMMQELSQLNINPDAEFESHTKEEQINRFEEDEKKFKLENSALLHNSGISQFSGIAAEDLSHWPSESTIHKPEMENKKLSIGQFFNMRSNRVSSLVGSVADDDKMPSAEHDSKWSTPNKTEKEAISKSELSLPICDSSNSEKWKPTRRCLSTYDLKRTPEIPKTARFSTDSSSSNSTVMIQNILAEMESGLSGTQIYEKLMKSYGRGKQMEKENGKILANANEKTHPNENGNPAGKAKGLPGNNETPKSSKASKRKEMLKKKREELTNSEKNREIATARNNLDAKKLTPSNREFANSRNNLDPKKLSPSSNREFANSRNNPDPKKLSPSSNREFANSRNNLDPKKLSPSSNREFANSRNNLDPKKLTPSNREFANSRNNLDPKKLSPLSNREFADSRNNLDPKKLSPSSNREFANSRNNLDPKKLSPSSTRTPFDCKENEPCVMMILTPDQSDLKLRSEKIKSLKGKKGFDASTPKFQAVRSQSDKFKTACGKVIMSDEDWEVPRVTSIQPVIDLNKSEFSEENEKTLLVNSTIVSSEPNKKNTIPINDTFTIEDTIVAGDLTVLSQRIDDMKADGVCIVRSEEPVLLKVVQKLAHLPAGTIDCSALTPLLRDQFPELLSTFCTPSKDQSLVTSFLPPTHEKSQDLLVSETGCWIKLPKKMGIDEKIYACVEVKKTFFIPLKNVSQNWLLVSLESATLIHSNGKKLPGVKKNDEWSVLDFLTVSMKDTIVPPESHQSLRIGIIPKIATKIDLKLNFSLKNIISREPQYRSIHVFVNCVNPLNYINVIPKDSINFGVIADQCYDHRTIQITYDGICELPLMVLIEENDSQSKHFMLKPYFTSNKQNQEEECLDYKFCHVFREGEKQLLEFRVFFQPNILLDSTIKTQNFKAQLILKIAQPTESDGILQSIPIKGSVGFAKFLCFSSCSPLVFRAPAKGQSVTRAYPVKNVGSIPIAFSIKILNEETQSEEEDSLFVTPKTFYLSKNEESAITVTFNAKTNETCTKRLMYLQIKPNGRANYDVELIGIVTGLESRPHSRASSTGASTKSAANSEAVPIKILTTAHSLTWPAVPLEREMRQSFQLKIASNISTTARISFKKPVDSFMLVNDNGEKVQKVRKVLKPDCSNTLTVAFRPDLVGAHHNTLYIETNHTNGKKMVTLSGIGGLPNLCIGNVKSDLNGVKMLRLLNSSNNQVYSNAIEFKNQGRIPGFILIKPSVEVLSLSHELKVTPTCCVIAPDSIITINLSQKLKNDDLKMLLSEKDISKLATLSVIMGDEPSRLRLRKLVNSGKVTNSERLRILTSTFQEEREMDLKTFDDPPVFENQFLKSLRIVEVAVVVEKSEIYEPTILIDESDTFEEFDTICTAAENTVLSAIEIPQQNDSKRRSGVQKKKSNDCNTNVTMYSSDSLSSQSKITKWLESLESPNNQL